MSASAILAPIIFVGLILCFPLGFYMFFVTGDDYWFLLSALSAASGMASDGGGET